MVFDAGSSHTSLFVYEWDSDKENNTGVVSQTLSCDVQGQYSPAVGSVLPYLSGGWGDLAGQPCPSSWYCGHRGAVAVAVCSLSPGPLALCGAHALRGAEAHQW